MTSLTARNSVVQLSNNMKTSFAVHVITKNDTIFFASSTEAAVTDHIKNNNKPVL